LGQQQQQQTGLGIVQQEAGLGIVQQQAGLGIVQQQQHHHLSSCMSTVQLESTAERNNRCNRILGCVVSRKLEKKHTCLH